METKLASKIRKLVLLLVQALLLVAPIYSQGTTHIEPPTYVQRLNAHKTLKSLQLQGKIGVNYGTVADNLPSAEEVARFLLNSTTITRVRLFDSDPETLAAFANTGIGMTVTVPTDQIPELRRLSSAQQWVRSNIVPHVHSTDIVRLLVGNEVLSTGSRLLISSLVPAMEALHAALAEEALETKIKVSTPHSLGILSNSSPPSAGRFRQGYDVYIIRPLLAFLRSTRSPFMINPYPFFGASEATLGYALFRANEGMVDWGTGLVYGNMVDAQLDAVFAAMKRLGFEDVEVVIAETGWPSRGDAGQLGADAATAAEYNGRLMRHVTSGVGTPLMPHRTFETYIFALFDEDLKPGPLCERSFGLFRPDFTPVYDVGILKPAVASASAADIDGRAAATASACLLMLLLEYFIFG